MARPPMTAPPVNPSALAKKEVRKDVARYLQVAEAFQREDRRADLRAMLGSNDLVDRFLSVALHAISTDSNLLLNATPESIIQAIRDSATLGLEPTGLTGEAWIICFKNQAKLMPGWRGYLARIRNSGQVIYITTDVVYANDEFRYGSNENGKWYIHNPAMPYKQEDGTYLNPRGGYWGAFAAATMLSGYKDHEVMPEVEINYVRDHFSESVKQGRSSPWDTSWGEMARKTVLRRFAKRLPQSAVEQLLRLDAAVDEAAREAAEEERRIAPSAARQAALRAVGAEVVNVSTEEPDDAPEAATEAETAAPETVEPEPRTVQDSDLSDLPEGWH
jgi:recombination protein RecT